MVFTMENTSNEGEEGSELSSASPTCFYRSGTKVSEEKVKMKVNSMTRPPVMTLPSGPDTNDVDHIKPKVTGQPTDQSLEVMTSVSDGAAQVAGVVTGVASVSKVNEGKSGRTRDRPRFYPGVQHQPKIDCQWSQRGFAPAQLQARRYTHSHHPGYTYPLTYPTSQRKYKSTSAMDYVNSPESFYAPEFAKSTFAASPNSLFMYDQERNDMQNTLNNVIFGQSCGSTDVTTLNSEPDFDLNPQYENSNSLEGFIGGALKCDALSCVNDMNLESSPSSCLDKPISGGLLGLLGVSRQDLKLGGPTLTELNMDPFLMDDIDTIISNRDPTEKPQSQTAQSSTTAKPMDTSDFTTVKPADLEVKSEASQETLTSLQCFNPIQTQVQGGDVSQPVRPLTNLFGTKSKVAVVQPVSASGLVIKTEPVDTYCESSRSPAKSSLHKLLSPESSLPRKVAVTTFTSTSPNQAVEPQRVLPVTGQTRAPPLGQQVKSESVEEKWKEIEKFIHDPESSNSNKRKRHASEASSATSDDEDYKSARLGGGYSDDDSDSDADSDISDTPLEDYSLAETAKKSKQYFWQYNVQAKGPKGTRLKLNINDSDPHHPSNFEDPVFDVNSTSLVGIRHGGKARKGDGNEVAPNPRKLFQIGKQLFKLNRQINGFQVSNDLPASVRNKSRKEKNKLASRACRLKKKAQHEANKVKLTGLDYEQGELLEIIRIIWPQVRKQARLQMKGLAASPGPTETLSDKLDALIKSKHKMVVAGNTTEFVNEVIAKVEAGDLTGGLDIKVKVKK